MDFLKICLVLSLCVALMINTVMSAPSFGAELMEPEFESSLDAETAMLPESDDNDIEDDIFSRIRRQVGQMASTRSRHRGSVPRRFSRRLAARRRHQTRSRSGRVVNY